MHIEPTSPSPSLAQAQRSLANGDRAGALQGMQDAVSLSGSQDDIGGLMSVWRKVADLLTGDSAPQTPVAATGKGRPGGGAGKGRPAPGSGKGRPAPGRPRPK